jgi:hypothetical protein
MTEQETAHLDEGTITYLRMVEEIVRENFTALDTSDSYAEGGDGSRRDVAEDDLKDLDLDQLEGEFRRLGTVLEGFWYIAEAMDSVVGMMVVTDARERARAALERVQEHRATWDGRG